MVMQVVNSMVAPESVPDPRAAERTLVLSYAPVDARGAVEALFALDDTLAAILRTTTEPMIGQMRLTWWHEALSALGNAAPPAHPLLRALAGTGVPGAELAGMIDGWDVLLEEPLDGDAMLRHAQARGGGLFRLVADVSGFADARVAQWGEGWALADLSRHLSDAQLAERAREEAGARLGDRFAPSVAARGRVLGALVTAARLDLAGRAAGSPGRVARLAWHRLTGR